LRRPCTSDAHGTRRASIPPLNVKPSEGPWELHHSTKTETRCKEVFSEIFRELIFLCLKLFTMFLCLKLFQHDNLLKGSLWLKFLIFLSTRTSYFYLMWFFLPKNV
jgi:hypothetical protein